MQVQGFDAGQTAGIAYLAAGQGRPIVFLHGIGGAARQFTPQLRHVSARYHAIAWDMPGYGRSLPLARVSIPALAKTLLALLDNLGLQRPVLVGHSMGGMIAQELIATAPDRVAALVLAQTSAAFGGKDPSWGLQFIAARLAPLDTGRPMAELAPEIVDGLLGTAPDPAGVALARECMGETPESAYRETVIAMPGFDRRAALSRIAVPTLVISGTLDENAPAASMQKMAEKIPGAHYVALEGVGHLAHLEQPARFNAALDIFLEGLPPWIS